MSEISRAISNIAYQAYEKRLIEEVNASRVPKHVAIIMDGNRRFEKWMGLGFGEGHLKGRDKLEEVMDWCREVGIKVVTTYAFSTENLKRRSDEVEQLMELFAENFKRAGDDERAHKYGIRIRVIGNRELLPQNVQDAIEYAEKRTEKYTNWYYNIAVAYGSREEILQAIQKISKDVKDGKLEADDIDEKVFSSYLYTGDMPDPELVLRTSGEERVSNFLLWQLAYSELYFTDVYWPGFRKVDFLRAIRSFQKRQRRYGT